MRRRVTSPQNVRTTVEYVFHQVRKSGSSDPKLSFGSHRISVVAVTLVDIIKSRIRVQTSLY